MYNHANSVNTCPCTAHAVCRTYACKTWRSQCNCKQPWNEKAHGITKDNISGYPDISRYHQIYTSSPSDFLQELALLLLCLRNPHDTLAGMDIHRQTNQVSVSKCKPSSASPLQPWRHAKNEKIKGFKGSEPL